LSARIGVAGFAEALGITPGALRMKMHRSRVARDHGRTFAGMLPEPDGPSCGHASAWLPETVAAYATAYRGSPGRPSDSTAGEVRAPHPDDVEQEALR